jgi:hypothetical protein
MIITLKQLQDASACEDQVKLFRKYFGSKVKVTKALCLKHASKFDWDWTAYHFLSTQAQEAYDTATAQAWEAYDTATAPTWEAYRTATARARKAYDTATARAWEAYNTATATAFFEATTKGEGQ